MIYTQSQYPVIPRVLWAAAIHIKRKLKMRQSGIQQSKDHQRERSLNRAPETAGNPGPPVWVLRLLVRTEPGWAKQSNSPVGGKCINSSKTHHFLDLNSIMDSSRETLNRWRAEWQSEQALERKMLRPTLQFSSARFVKQRREKGSGRSLGAGEAPEGLTETRVSGWVC